MLEKELYPLVDKWLKKNYLCFKTEIDTGLKLSRADIIGIRDVGGDLTGETETIIVEVKNGNQAFVTSAGQTLGYKIYANRVFLADRREDDFSIDERMIANHLGIGLIRIMKNNCKEILSSPYYSPIPKFSSLILEKMKLGYCRLCGSTFEIGTIRNFDNLVKYKASNALKKRKGLMFWNHEVAERKRKMGIKTKKNNLSYERRFICKDCIETIKR
jgi:hypothetical protein